MDVCAKFQGNPSNNFWNISVWTKAADQPHAANMAENVSSSLSLYSGEALFLRSSVVIRKLLVGEKVDGKYYVSLSLSWYSWSALKQGTELPAA